MIIHVSMCPPMMRRLREELSLHVALSRGLLTSGGVAILLFHWKQPQPAGGSGNSLGSFFLGFGSDT